MDKSNLKALYADLKRRGYRNNQAKSEDPYTSSKNKGIVLADGDNYIGVLTPSGKIKPFNSENCDFVGDTATDLNTLFDNLTGDHYTVYDVNYNY